MSYPAITVANTIVKKAIDLKIPDFTHLKLQKLLYLAHSWTLALTKKPLIEEDFHAWQHGPVVPIIYSYFCKFQKKEINQLAVSFFKDETNESSVYEEPVLETNSKDYKIINAIIDKVIKHYGYCTPWQLVDKTHAPGGPWDIAKKNNQEIISNDSIEKYMCVKIGAIKENGN